MEIKKLHNLQNKNGDIILLDQGKKIIKIKDKLRKTIVKIDYVLQPKEAIKILEERKFINNKKFYEAKN